MPVIMDEAYVRRVRRRHLAAARSARKQAGPALFAQSAGVSTAAAPVNDIAGRCGWIDSKQHESSESESPLSPSTCAAASPSVCSFCSQPDTPPPPPGAGGDSEDGPWWDAATEAELLRPAKRAAAGGGAALGLDTLAWGRCEPAGGGGDEWP